MLLDHDFEGNLNAIGIYGINLEVFCVLGVPAYWFKGFSWILSRLQVSDFMFQTSCFPKVQRVLEMSGGTLKYFNMPVLKCICQLRTAVAAELLLNAPH